MKKQWQKLTTAFLLLLAVLMTSVAMMIPVGASGTNEAKIGTQEYATLREAVSVAASGAVIDLLTDVSLDGNGESGRTDVGLVINKSLTINGNGKTITGNSRRVIRIFGGASETDAITVNLNNLTVYVRYETAGVRCLETRGGYMTVNLDGCRLEAVNAIKAAAQPITIGGNHANTVKVNIKNSEIIAGLQRDTDPQNPKYNAELGFAPGHYGYAIIAFNPVELKLENSKVVAWSAVYLHAPDSSYGAKGSSVTMTGCDVKSINDYNGLSNDFGTVVVEQPNCTVNISGTAFELSTMDKQNAPQNFVLLQDNPDAGVAEQVQNAQISISGETSVQGAVEGGLVVDYSEAESSNAVSVSGGTFNVAVDDRYCAPGYVVVATPDGNGGVTYGASTKEAGREKAVAQMDALKEACYTANRYTEENKKKIEKFYADAKEAVEATNSGETINGIVALFQSQLASVDAIPLATLREEAILKLQREKIALVEKNRYNDAGRKSIEQYQAEAKAAIEAAKTPAEIEAACAAFSEKIAKVEIAPEVVKEEKTPAWVIALIVVGAVILALVALIIIIKVVGAKKRAKKFAEQATEQESAEQPVAEVKEEKPATEVKEEKPAEEAVKAEAETLPEITEEQEETAKEVAAEEAPAQEAAEEATEEAATVESAPAAENVELDAEKKALFESFAAMTPKTFAERLEGIDETAKGFYEQITAELLSYKSVKSRLSQKGNSFRVGRKLIAKIVITGKTVKCYLALDPAAHDAKLYRYTDMSARRSCAAVPVLMRVRSKLAAKRTLKLIAILAEENGLVKK